jgi:hypothetical protein
MHRLGVARVRVIAACSIGIVGCGAMLGLLVALAPRPALAQSASFQLRWDAPVGCPDEGYVRTAIEQLLAGGPGSSARVEARAVVGRSETGQWRVRLATVREGATGERSLEAASCRSLADATALIVALTIDPARVAANRPATAADASTVPPEALDGGATPASDATVAPDSTVPAPDSGPSPPASSASTATVRPDAATPPPVQPPVRDSRAHLAVFASADGDVGSLPRPAYGFSIGAAVVFRTLRIEGYGSYWPFQTVRAQFPGDRINISLVTAGARGCFVPIRGIIDLGACSGVELGSEQGQGFGPAVPPNSSASQVWFAGTADLRAAWNIVSRFSLVLDGGIVIPFDRLTFQLNSDAPTPPSNLTGFLSTKASFTPSAVAGRLYFGPEFRF